MRVMSDAAYMAVILLAGTVVGVMLTGCKTAPKTENPDFYYNMGRTAAEKECAKTWDQFRDALADYDRRLQACMDAGSREK